MVGIFPYIIRIFPYTDLLQQYIASMQNLRVYHKTETKLQKSHLYIRVMMLVGMHKA